MKKRITSLLLLLTLLLGLLPAQALAASPTAVSSAAEFAAMEANGSYELTADITVTAPYGSSFTGSFDGKGHTVTLAISGSDSNVGLFSEIGTGGTVKNVLTDGSVSGDQYVAGIAGKNAGTIENCLNKAAISASGTNACAGIVAETTGGNIKSCGNTGTITAGSNGRWIGGITGNLKNTTISDCYNQGDINTTRKNPYVGGIVGNTGTGGSIGNCYNTGIINISDTTTQNYGGIIGWLVSAVSFNTCYYLDTSTSNGVGGYNLSADVSAKAISKTADEMQSADFAETLGDGFMFRAGSYPVLAWQTPTASVAFTIAPANAVLTINGSSCTGSTTVSLPAGEYPYTVSCDGYTQQTGSITVTDAQAESGAALEPVSVTLVKDAALWCAATFQLTPSDATVEVKDGNTVVAPESDGSYQLLKAHSYRYTVIHSDETYVASSGECTPSASTLTQEVTLKQVASIELTGTYKTEYTQGDALDTTGMQIILHYVGSEETETVDMNADATVTGFDSSQPADAQTLTVKYHGRTTTYDIKINEKGFPSTIFNTLKGKATVEYSHNTSYKGEDGQEFVDHTDGSLKSNSADMNNATVTITIKFADNLPASTFSFDYKVSAETYGDGIQINGGNTIGGQQTSFTSYTANVKGGDTFTITYKKDYSARSGDDCIYLKNFQLGQRHDFKLTVSPEDADVKLTKQGDTTAISGTQTGGVYTYQLMEGSYAYTVSKFGYTAQTGTITVPTDSEKAVTLAESAKQTVTFTVTKPEGLTGDYTLTVKHGSDTMTSTAANTYELYDGDYTYTVTHDRCETVSGSFTVNGAAVTEAVTLVRKLVFADFFDGVDGITATNDATYPYKGVKDDSGNYLQSDGVKNYEKATITLKATQNVVLSFDYWGSNYRYSSYPFTVKKGNTTLLNSYDKSSWASFSTTLLSGETLTLCYEQPYSYGSVSSYYVRLKNFSTQALRTVTFTGLPDGAELVVKQGDAVQTAQADGSYLLPAGDYSYSVTAPGYKALTDQKLTVADTDMTVPVTMQQSTFTFEKAFEGVQDVLTAANDADSPFVAFETDDGGYLQSSNNKNGTNSSISLNFTKPARLSFQYWVSESGSAITSTTQYGLVVKNGDKLVYNKVEVSTGWQTCTLDVNAGETLTISYSCFVNSNDMSPMDENFLRLQNFQATALCAVSFTGAPKGTTITVKRGDDTLQPYSGSTYLLEAGTYSYSIAAFGYTGVENQSLTVAAGDSSKAVSAKLTALATKTIRFAVDPADATISLRHETAGDMDAFRQADGSYKLPANESYSYTVSKDGYVERRGSFTADKDQTITVPALVFCGEAWDGSTKTEPAQKDGIYQISNAAELAWFADAVNGGKTSLSAQLTANINLGGKDWSDLSFGSYDYSDNKSGFAGTLDGQNYMVSGLTGEKGLVDCLAPTGTVKNLTVNGDLSGSYNVGGIVSISKGTVENCKFLGSISGDEQRVGGIVGQGMTGNVIRGCVNAGTVDNTYSMFARQLDTGGIAGSTYGTIESCYNVGTVSAKVTNDAGRQLDNYAIGGIVGSANSGSTVTNVYNTGKVTGPTTDSGAPGALVGSNSGAVTNAWYLIGTADKAAGKGTAIQNADKTAAVMKSDRFAFDLGEAFRVDSDGSNSGYPVLAWQGGREPVISDDNDAVELAAAALVLKKADGEAIPAEDGKYPIRDELSLLLEKTGNHNTSITWSANPTGYVDLKTGKVSLPLSGHPEVTLTATITRGEASAQKQFTLLVWSSAAAAQKLLDQIKAEATKDGVFLQPLEIYDHSNIVDAMEQYLLRGDYTLKTSKTDGIEVSLVSIGTKLSPANESKNLAEDGTITYYTDISAAENYATYQNVTFRLTLGDATVDIPVTVHIGWSEEFADDYMLNAAKSITWDMIRGQNENGSTTTGGKEGDSEWWETVTVDGSVSNDLLLPLRLTNYPAVTVAWMSKTTSAMTVKDNGNGTYTGVLNRPVFGQPDTPFLLTARVSFNRLDDYMKQEMTMEGGSYESNCYEVKNFNMKIAASNDDIGKEIYNALAQYPTLLRDFVDKTKKVDCDHVTDDMQMPRPATLEDAGILPDSYNEKVTMESKTPDVLDFNGYHAVVYRPLPGSAPATATYTVSVYDRPSGALLATRDFTITVDPLTQEEIDDAKAFMDMVATGQVYWEGIKNANTDKDNVTSDLDSFVEILPDGKGGYTFVRGMANITFGGVEVDDLPGYDPMGTQNWREFRSSRESIITSETLFVTRPDYDTHVKIDSVLTHNAMAKYWTKFQNDPAYAQFEQFYKRPVSAAVTVKGTKGGSNPNPVDRIQVTVGIDGNKFENFRNTADFSFSRDADADWTAWDAVEAFFQANGYTYKGGGNYISAITDPAGVELAELEHGENSGWMYKVNGELPDQLLSQYVLKNGDKIELFYTGDYKTVPGGHGGGSSTVDTAVKNVESLIQAIGTVTEASGDKIQAARAAYDKLTDAQKKQVSNYSTLTAAESAFRDLRGDLPFTDVSREHWAYSYIQQVYQNKLMNGVSATAFAPEDSITRSMIVTMLYRLAGSPAVTGSAAFTDVNAGSYYEKAVIWASANGIVKGVSETSFAPEENITREQLAAMLYRYAQFSKLDTSLSEDTNILSFADASSISEYAMPAIQWACGAGLIQGRTENTLVPQGTATRAEAATIFVRFQALGSK